MMRANELVDKGVAEYARGLPEEAERLWREALAVDPGCERARTYLEQLRAAPGSGLRPPGVAAAPAPAGEPADAARPEAESSGGPTSPARGPARFSLSPEKARGGPPPGPRFFGRKAVLLVATAVAVIAADRMGPGGGPDRQECEPGLDRAPRRGGGLRGTRRLARGRPCASRDGSANRWAPSLRLRAPRRRPSLLDRPRNEAAGATGGRPRARCVGPRGPPSPRRRLPCPRTAPCDGPRWARAGE